LTKSQEKFNYVMTSIEFVFVEIVQIKIPIL